MRSKNDWLGYLEHSALCHYGVVGMHWGVRRYQPYSSVPRESGKGGKEIGKAKNNHSIDKKANKIYKKATKKEPRITKAVLKCVEKNGGTLYGLDHKLKTKESIARKLESKEVNDAVRYTAILSEHDFVKQYKGIRSSLKRRGYDEVKCKNYFEEYNQGKVNHKSVQCNYETIDGYQFEIQFQTKASQRAKDKKVPLYEEARNPKTSKKRQQELAAQMRSLADKVNDPPDISKIKTYDVSKSRVRKAVKYAKIASIPQNPLAISQNIGRVEANRAMSLAMTGGMNPFIFG